MRRRGQPLYIPSWDTTRINPILGGSTTIGRAVVPPLKRPPPRSGRNTTLAHHQQHNPHQPTNQQPSILLLIFLLLFSHPLVFQAIKLCTLHLVYDIFTQKDPANLYTVNVCSPPPTLLSKRRLMCASSGNSNISYYQARAAAQVYSTARSVLPSWTTNYFLPDPHPQTPSSPSPSSSSNNQDPPAASVVDHSLQDRFVAFDVLRGRDVLVKAKDCGFSIYNVGDRTAELDELCGYSYFDEVIYVKVLPPPKNNISYPSDHP